MNFNQLLLILRARWLVALFALLVTVATTVAVSLSLPKTYKATATLLVDSKAKDPVTGQLLPAQLIPGYVATQVDVIQSRNVALKVVDQLRMADNPAVQQDFAARGQGAADIRHWLADLLARNLEVRPSRESSVIHVSFSGSDPRFAALVANAFAQAYIATNLELRIEPARLTSAWYDDKLKELRLALETAQNRLTAYQRENALFASDERLDVETARLAELSSQLVSAQAHTYDAASRQMQTGNNLPDIINSPLVQSLRADVARGESRLAELAEKLGENHPHYQRAATELQSLREKLEDEIDTVTRGVGSVVKVARQRESDLRGSLAAQKARVLDLKDKRDQLSVLMREVEHAQRAYEIALQRQTQASLESRSTQTEVAVLNPAIPPAEAASPKIRLNALIALFLGAMLGIAVAFLLEMVDRRVRSAEDLAGMLDLPVLGEIAPRRRARLALFRRRPTVAGSPA